MLKTPDIVTSVDRMPADLIRQFEPFSSADVHEASGQQGALHSSVKPVVRGQRILGSALTVRGRASDDLIHHIAIHVARPNDVIVAEVGGDSEAAIWGGLMCLSAQQRGAAGLVIDGAVRDTDEIRASGFPVYSSSVCIKGTGKDKPGWVNHPIVCAGVAVHPGDLVVGDDDGVVVVKREDITAVLEACRARHQREAYIVSEIQRGRSTFEIMELSGLAAKLGITWEDEAAGV